VEKTETSGAHCNCTGTGYDGPFCENDINDCVVNVTCLNGGTCIDYGVNKTFCVCPFGFIGDKCELCPPNTCKNGGDCIIQNGISTCNCFGTGYEGDKCQFQKEDCRKNGCGLGRCVTISQSDSSYCNCFGTGYGGDYCEISKNDCKTLPCFNGLCIELEGDSRRCSCLPGYEGNRCEIQKEDCRKNGCGFGRCITILESDSASCNCFGTGYEGNSCEISKNDCKTLPCVQGLCTELGNDMRKCSCLPGYEGDRCEIQKEDCRKNGCGLGRCITIAQNDTAYCNCFGSGYEGAQCEIQKEDCRKNGCGEGRCITISHNDTAFCNCFGSGYEGNRCQFQKEDCRKNGCGEGKCVVISQNDTAHCDCQKTGYEGDFCEKEKDCRSKKCLNNGECRIDYESDTARCICGDEFKGETCSMEKYSTVEQVTVYYFLGPIFIIYLLVCVGIFTQARKADKETKKSWIFFLLRFLMSCLGIFDLLTDIFFVIQSYDYGVENNNFGFFWSSLGFTILPWSLAAICTGIFLTAWRKKLNLDKDSHNKNFMIFSFFTVISLLSANGVETFHLVTQYLFLKEGRVIQVSDYAGYLTIYFIVKTFIEDFPQLIIQGIFQSKLGKADAIVTLSLASSALSCFITAVTFPFTHEFEYIKIKIRRFGRQENFEPPSKAPLFPMQ